MQFCFLAARTRSRALKYGIQDEPFSFFIVKNVLVAAAIIYLSYLLSTYRGLPNVLMYDGGADCDLYLFD